VLGAPVDMDDPDAGTVDADTVEEEERPAVFAVV
jgi:hypothetical protein